MLGIQGWKNRSDLIIERGCYLAIECGYRRVAVAVLTLSMPSLLCNESPIRLPLYAMHHSIDKNSTCNM